MIDPYQVLGISKNASDEEIKKAYRLLSRKYHPDANINNPNAAQAEERFKQVQAAYNQIMQEKEKGYSWSGYHSQEKPEYQSNQEDVVKMQAVANYLNTNQYQQALNLLSNMSERTSRWYYFAAIANMGLGNNINAIELARQAAAMEPSNMEYQSLMQRLQFGGQWYNTMGNQYGRTNIDMGSCCYKLCLANLFCNCCFRPC